MRTRSIAGSALQAAASPVFIPGNCFVTDLVGDFVYIRGDKVGDDYLVQKCDIDDAAKMPAVGVIVAKSTQSNCTVQLSGTVIGLYTGLTPGARLFVGTDAQPSETFAHPLSGVRLLQEIAVAISSEDIRLAFQMPIGILPL